MVPDHTPLELCETREAFDSIAADYDGPRGNNALIQDMRAEMWRCLDGTFSPGDHLVDLGCGTGLDAARMALLGYRVTATDWSAAMVARTRDRAMHEGVAERVRALAVGAHELERLQGDGAYDGAYSNLGPLNCVPDLSVVSSECARLLKPRGTLVFTVIGRVCPWELAHYVARGQWARAKVRFERDVVPVGMDRGTVWTRYYTPREFYRPFRDEFALRQIRALCLFAPPPYLSTFRERHPRWYQALWSIDRSISAWPLLRAMGDHFLIVMKKRDTREPGNVV